MRSSTPSTDDPDLARAQVLLSVLEASGGIVVDPDPETRAWVERMLALDFASVRLAAFRAGWMACCLG